MPLQYIPGKMELKQLRHNKPNESIIVDNCAI